MTEPNANPNPNPKLPDDERWARDVLGKLALTTVTEQRRARRWGIFFKLLFFALQAERQANIEADLNNGEPTKSSLENLYRAYSKVESVLKAAETLELLNELYPSVSNFNEIGVLYTNAGYDAKALKYYELAYKNNKNATTAFNYAHQLKSIDKNKFKEILEESP